MMQTLGKIQPAVGVPLRATNNQSAPAARVACHGVLIQALPTNVGRVYVGDAALNRATFGGLYAILATPSGSLIPTFSAALTLAPNAINVADLFLDVDNAGDGVIVSVLIT